MLTLNEEITIKNISPSWIGMEPMHSSAINQPNTNNFIESIIK